MGFGVQGRVLCDRTIGLLLIGLLLIGLLLIGLWRGVGTGLGFDGCGTPFQGSQGLGRLTVAFGSGGFRVQGQRDPQGRVWDNIGTWGLRRSKGSYMGPPLKGSEV